MDNIYSQILHCMERGNPVLLETYICGKGGEIREKMARRISPFCVASGQYTVGVDVKETNNGTVIREPMFPKERLILLGAGHIAVPLCEFAAKIGFSVTVCDDRSSFANHRRFPLANEVICDSFPNALERLQITAFDYVVVITRGHRYDADCLRQLLPRTFPAYLGLIGSKRRVKGLMDMLGEEGYSRSAMEKIFTPIGLKIGAVTPEEIAVSIVAELIACKRMPEYRRGGHSLSTDSDAEIEVIRHLANSPEPKAIVTVIETKGSTPRSAGAKMAVNSIGQTVGSIGGGCSEGEIILTAVRMIGTGTYKVVDIDLTGDVAESEGMVCGGIMRVLIEDQV